MIGPSLSLSLTGICTIIPSSVLLILFYWALCHLVIVELLTKPARRGTANDIQTWKRS